MKLLCAMLFYFYSIPTFVLKLHLPFYIFQSQQAGEGNVSYITPWHLSLQFVCLPASHLHFLSPSCTQLSGFKAFFFFSQQKHALWLWALASLASVCSSRSDCWSLFMRTWVSMLLSPTFTCKYACIQYLHSSFRDPWEAFKEEVNKSV